MFSACVVAVLALRSPTAVPGDVAFDPLSLGSKDVFLRARGPRPADSILFDYREAELKHGRLAMLAAVAYPTQEVVNPVLAKALHLPNLLASMTLSPSLVNGGLAPSVLIAFLGLGSALELYKGNAAASSLPADYGWRVTEAADDTPAFGRLQSAEVWNGRLAMIAVLGYVVQEASTKTSVTMLH